METDEAERAVSFQLQFDKPIASQVKIAEWNSEKDLLAMVNEDSKILLHRFNWQRLWTISPGRPVKSLCWRPDGKVLALGLEDGTVSLHDVENGKLLRSLKSHTVAVVCLNWVEDSQLIADGQIVLLLNETTSTSEGSFCSYMMVVQANDLPFVSVPRSPCLDNWKVHQLKDYVVPLQIENEKVRNIPHAVIPPLAVSGVACVFAARRRALVYILEEDEDEMSEAE